MSRRFILERETRLFANWLAELLNGTVSNGVRLEWQRPVEKGRAEYRRIQFAAFARADPALAGKALRDLDQTA